MIKRNIQLRDVQRVLFTTTDGTEFYEEGAARKHQEWLDLKLSMDRMSSDELREFKEIVADYNK